MQELNHNPKRVGGCGLWWGGSGGGWRQEKQDRGKSRGRQVWRAGGRQRGASTRGACAFQRRTSGQWTATAHNPNQTNQTNQIG